METHWSIWIFGLLLPPLVALLYCAIVLGMYSGFHEFSVLEKYPSLIWRTLVLGGAAAITYSDRYANQYGSDISEVGRILVLSIQAAILWSVSFYFIMETRYIDVVGGPNPSAKLLESNSGSKPPLKDKIVLVTGSNAGIGKETAKQLAELGATKVILACRSPKRGQQAMEELRQQTTTKTKFSQYMVLECDLGSFDSIRKAVEFLKKRQSEDIPQIDILVLNAGVMMGEQTTTKDGYETMMQANLLGHYLMTRLLLDNKLLKPNKKDPPRVIHLTSCTHQIAILGHGSMDFDDLMCSEGKRQYTLFGQYAQSKLGNILFAKELARRFQSKIISLAVHPGTVRTEVTRNMPFWLKLGNDMFAFVIAACQKSVEQGAWCTVSASTLKVDTATVGTYDGDGGSSSDGDEKKDKTDPGIPNGSYLQNGRVRQTDPYTYDEADARKLWDLSEKLVGLEQK